jgi:hypothetical protein
MRVYRERQVTPASTCLPSLVRGAVVAAANRAPIPFLAERGTLSLVSRLRRTSRSRHVLRGRFLMFFRCPTDGSVTSPLSHLSSSAAMAPRS